MEWTFITSNKFLHTYFSLVINYQDIMSWIFC